ncbi:MAG TPA: hypothetical protein VIL74_18145 [Pyrinomonadaceae bacterium]|jgi:hypothetical protein
MSKTILHRLFGFGRIPAQYAPALSAEGVILSDEGIKGTVTFRDFRAPGRYANWKRQWFTASIVLTNERLRAFRHSSQIVDVPLADPRFRRLDFSVEEKTTLLVAFDAALFHDDWSGGIEYRFATPFAEEFRFKLIERQRPASAR